MYALAKGLGRGLRTRGGLGSGGGLGAQAMECIKEAQRGSSGGRQRMPVGSGASQEKRAVPCGHSASGCDQQQCLHATNSHAGLDLTVYAAPAGGGGPREREGGGSAMRL